MTVFEITHPISIDVGVSSVDRSVDCIDVKATGIGTCTTVSFAFGLIQRLPPMAQGFSPRAEVLQGYPQGSDHRDIPQNTVDEGSPVLTLAPVSGIDGFPLNPDSVLCITGRLHSETALGSREVQATRVRDIDPRTAMRATLIQGDPRYTGAGGFNFEDEWPGSDFVGGGRSYRLEYEIEYAGPGGDRRTAWVLHSIQVRGIWSRL